MQRSIKFRAWTGTEMLVVASLGFSKQFEPGEPEFVDAKEITELYCLDGIYGKVVGLKPTCPIMQSTGLNDKNGTPIFEGDILTTPAREEARQVVWNNQGAVFYLHPLGEAKQDEVDVDEFNTPTSMAAHWFTQGYYDTHEIDCAVEVIGNIWEKPDLIKVDGVSNE